jgi:hypothetical protein
MADSVAGELGFSGGVIFPQGDFARYSDPGPTFMLRVNPHLTKAKFISGWFTFGLNFFDSDETPVIINDNIPGKKNVDQYGLSLHFGLQFGSESRRGFFRPRAAIAPGFYYFNTETSIRPLDYEEDLIEVNDGQFRFGWKAALGTDFFFSSRWGVSFDFIYDHVVNMKRYVEVDQEGNREEVKQSSRFQGFHIGVVVTFEAMEE